MEINNMSVVYYSPTYTSQKIARAVADGLGIALRTEHNLTTDRETDIIPIKDSICVVAAPVYGGLTAPVALERFKRLKGENSIAIPLVVYGNRDYEDALVQLRDQLQQQGFTVLCGAAFIGEHSFSRPDMPVAEGRPDADDLHKAVTFGQKALQSLCSQLHITEQPDTTARQFALTYSQSLNTLVSTPFMKGNVPYKEAKTSAPAAPVVNDLCYGCGECETLCPTGAITIVDGRSTTDISLCTKCCACVKYCPVGARVFDTPFTAMLHQNFSARREPECFL